MAIQISGTTVIDDSRNITNGNNANFGSGNVTVTGSSGDISVTGTITAANINLPLSVSSFSPADGATDVSRSTDIVITFNQNVSKGTGNITIRSGSASGTVIETFDVASSGLVTISGAVVTLNPSDFDYSTDVYVVVDAGAIKGVFTTNTIINTYNFTTPPLNLGDSFEGGNLICKANPVRWIAAPAAAEITSNWYSRSDANTCAQNVSGCSGWFVPSISQLQNPGSNCREYWETPKGNSFWSNTNCGYFYTIGRAWRINLSTGGAYCIASKTNSLNVRSFRCVTY